MHASWASKLGAEEARRATAFSPDRHDKQSGESALAHTRLLRKRPGIERHGQKSRRIHTEYFASHLCNIYFLAFFLT
jgi:hypothetical protein